VKTNNKKSKFKKAVTYIFSSICIGFVNGFFGGGGGMVTVPLLEKGLHLPVKKSHATAIFVILPLSIASVMTYKLESSFDWGILLWVSGGFIIGGIIGALILPKLNSKFIQVLFAVIMLVAGVKMCI